MKKVGERAIVEAFLRSQTFPSSSLIDCERERPDALLVGVGPDIVGVEVTTVVEAAPRQPVAPQKWKTEAVRIVGKAQQAFERVQADRLIVRLELRDDWQPGSAEAATLATGLAATVAGVLRNPPFFVRAGEPITVRDPHPVLSWMYLDRAHHGTQGHWAPSFSGDVLTASASDIRETVRKKEAELTAYRLVAPVIWLLIDCDLDGQGMTLDVPEPFPITTGFDRVFCCGFGRWKWVEIPTTSRHSMGPAARRC